MTTAHRTTPAQAQSELRFVAAYAHLNDEDFREMLGASFDLEDGEPGGEYEQAHRMWLTYLVAIARVSPDQLGNHPL